MIVDRHTNWTVAWICCVLAFLLLGTTRLSGLLFVSVMEHYDVSRSQASLPFVLCYTVRNISGPLIGYLGRRWGYNVVCMTGCLLSSIGIGCCFFAQSIITVTILWGGVFGLGLGLSTVLIPEVLRHHFSVDLSKANGIALGGECLAGFILPLFLDASLNMYGTQGTFLILSGLVLNSIPAALFLREIKPRVLSSIKPEIQTAHKNCKKVTSSTRDLQYGIINDKNINGKISIPSTEQAYSSIKNSKHSMSAPCLTSDHLRYFPSDHHHDTNNSYNTIKDYHNTSESFHRHEANPHYYLSDSHLGGYHNPLAYFQNSSDGKQYCSSSKSPSDRSESNSNPISGSDFHKKSPIKSFAVFLDISFILILIHQSLLIYVITTALTIVVDYSKDIGVATYEEIYIVMGMSIADMIGRFGLGFVTDSGYMTKTSFTASCYAAMGLLLFASVYVNGFVLLMTTMLPIGLLLGGVLIVFPGLVTDFVEEDQVTMALASRMSLYGPLSLSQSSFIGYFRSSLGSYHGVYYTLTILCFICSALTILTPYAARRRTLRKNIQEQETQPIIIK